MSDNGLNFGCSTCLFTSPRAFQDLSGLHTDHQNVDLKQIHCQIFPQQRWVYSEIEIWSLPSWWACASSHMTKEEEHPYRGKEEVGSREAFSEEGVHGFSLAEALPWKNRSLSPSCWALISSEGVRALPSGFPSLIEICLLNFLHLHLFWVLSWDTPIIKKKD